MRNPVKFLDSSQLEWQSLAGVEGMPEGIWWKVLKRDPETGGVTAIVKYDPEFELSASRHEGAVEIFVLRGVADRRANLP